MIELVAREQAFFLNSFLSTYIIHLQEAEFNDIQEDLSLEDLLKYGLSMDDINVKLPPIYHLGEMIITLPERDINAFAKGLGKSFAEIARKLDWEKLIFLPVLKTPWFSQVNTFPPVKAAHAYLAENGVSPDFNGAIIVPDADVATFISHLFWLVRCNAAMPEIAFTGIKAATSLSLCKYGGLHCHIYDETEKGLILTYARANGYIMIPSEMCFNNFGQNGIEGRETIA